MKWWRWLCLLLVMGVSGVSFAGDIQVACGPGLRVLLDGKLVGLSSPKDDGLFLANVPEGLHVLRVEKDGFVPQSFQVEVAKLPLEVKVAELLPEAPLHAEKGVPGGAEVKQPGGSVLVTSAPQNCVVEIDGKPETKSTPVLRIDGLAAGKHPVAFSKPGYDRISGVVSIQPGASVTVRGDLVAGKVETTQEGVGSLRLTSTPNHCTVRLLGLTRETTNGRLNISHLPAGEHRLVVTWKNLEHATNVIITNGHRTVVVVSFMKGDEPFAVSYEPE